MNIFVFWKISEEEKKRKLSLLKIIFLGIIFSSFVATVINFFYSGYSYNYWFEFLPGLIFILFCFLYFLLRRGFLLIPAIILIGLLFFVSYCLGFQFGTLLPMSWIIFILAIIIAGTVVGTRFSCFLLIIHTFIFLFITDLQCNGKILYKNWNISPDLFSVTAMMSVVAILIIISWLSNKEIESALKKVKKSENNLRKEKDNLEIEVEKRTKELKKIQLEKITYLYKFADFGRLTAGLFHDISNPLTQVSLNLSNIKNQTKNKILPELKELNPVVRRAINGTKQMEKLVISVRKQIQEQETKSFYNPLVEIKTAMENFEYKAKQMRVQINIIGEKNICTFGNPLRFYQLASNFISNALDSYYEVKRINNRIINIYLSLNENNIVLKFEDFGCGIDNKIIKKIFDPLFTTKDSERGTGVGLYISKNIVEKELNGKIEVESNIKKGTLFVVKFPLKEKPNEEKY